MTCIVGIRDKNWVTIGGDSAGVAGYQTQIRKDPKVFKKEEKMIFGFTSSFRMGELLQFKLKLPKHPKGKEDYEYMCTDFIDAVMKCLEDNHYALVKDNQMRGGTFLVGYNGRLYTVHGNYQVGELYQSYAACGSGEEFALGSLHSTTGIEYSVDDRIEMALLAAEEFSVGVRAPFNTVSLSKRKGRI